MGINTSISCPESMSLSDTKSPDLCAYHEVFQCDSGSEFKADVTKLWSNDTTYDDEVQTHSHGIRGSFE